MDAVSKSTKKRFQRLDTSMPVALSAIDGGKLEARILHIGPDGCLLETAAPVRVSEILIVTFGRQAAPITFRAKVQSSVPKGEVFQYGTCFWAVDEEAKRELIKNLVQVAALFKPAEAGRSEPAPPEENPEKG